MIENKTIQSKTTFSNILRGCFVLALDCLKKILQKCQDLRVPLGESGSFGMPALSKAEVSPPSLGARGSEFLPGSHGITLQKCPTGRTNLMSMKDLQTPLPQNFTLMRSCQCRRISLMSRIKSFIYLCISFDLDLFYFFLHCETSSTFGSPGLRSHASVAVNC